MRHQENVVRCLHIMYMCEHVLYYVVHVFPDVATCLTCVAPGWNTVCTWSFTLHRHVQA